MHADDDDDVVDAAVAWKQQTSRLVFHDFSNGYLEPPMVAGKFIVY